MSVYQSAFCCQYHDSLQAVVPAFYSVRHCMGAIQCILFAPMSRLLLSMAHRHGTSGSVLLMQVSIMSAIRHPNVVLFMGVCLDPPCMVTEVTANSTLHDLNTICDYAISQSSTSGWRLQVTTMFTIGPAPLLYSRNSC